MKTTLTLKKRVSLCFSFFILAGLATLQGVAGAQVNMPEFDRLSPLTNGVSAPADVALDQQGRVYIAETTKNRVTVLTQSGRSTGQIITSVFEPISVAVDSSGRILVGSARNGSVAVFSSDLAFLFKLGSGDGEFAKPMDIAIDATGKIYVVDKPNHAINTYNSSGAPTGSIGTPGNGAGQLHHPTSIAIDENSGEIAVLDHQQILDSNTGKMIDGSRIQYFDMNGIPVPNKSYSKFGYNNAGMNWTTGTTTYDITMGQLTRPNQITVDSMSRLYVTDARLQKVMVYDNFDNFLGTIDSVTSPLRIPIGIAIGASDRLHVASLFTRKVEVFGVGNYTAMITTPPVIEFNAVENGNAPPPQAVTITNQGKAEINLTSSTPDPWVSMAATTSTLLPTETASLDIAVIPDGFAPGEYTSNVSINTGAGISEVIKVVLTVEPNPLQVAPGSLSFETTVGTTAAGQQLAVTSGAPGVLQWDVSADQPWIGLNKTTGVGEGNVRVYADISALNPETFPATFNGMITFVQQGTNPSSVDIPVSLTLNESTTPPEDLPGLDDSGKKNWNKKWTITQLLPGTALNGVAGASKDDVFAVGENGTIFHFDGNDWTQMNTGTATLNSVWSSSESNSYAVGAEGQVLNFNGTDWNLAATTGDSGLQDIWGSSDTNIVTADEFGTIIDSSFANSAELGVALRTVWGSADNDVFVAGEGGSIFRYDGTDWIPMASNTTEWLNGISGTSSSNVFAVGENGTIVHYDGTNWTAMVSGTSYTLNGVCGFSETDVYAVGDNSLIVHYNGSEWSAFDAGAGVNLNDIWCSGKGDIFAVGDDGTIIHGKGNNKFPWVRVIQQIALNAAKTKEKNEQEENK